MKVAGDVIKDWTPRQANTFEKLSEVLNLGFFSSKPSFQFMVSKKDHIFYVNNVVLS